MYVSMPKTDIALLLRHGMLYKKLVASVTKMLDHYSWSSQVVEKQWGNYNDFMSKVRIYK